MVVAPDWKVVRLGDFSETIKGQGLSRSKLSEGGRNPCLLYGELFTTYSRVIREVVSFTNSHEGTVSRVGDVLMPGSTTTTGEDLATASALMVSGVHLGGDVNIIRPNPEYIDSRWLAYRLTYCHRGQIGALTQGSTIHHLYGRDIASLEIPLPTIEEQSSIAQVLINADTSIKSLEALIEKNNAVKQGMIQKLLAGKVRLV